MMIPATVSAEIREDDACRVPQARPVVKILISVEFHEVPVEQFCTVYACRSLLRLLFLKLPRGKALG